VNKRKGSTANSLKIKAKCSGYIDNGKIHYANHCHGVVIIPPDQYGWPMCNACHDEFYTLKSNRIFRSIKLLNKQISPAIRRKAHAFVYFTQYMEEKFGVVDYDVYNIIKDIHIDVTRDFVATCKDVITRGEK
jgi:hypothetical protein